MTEDWNASLYLRFERGRTQPSRDLVARITIERPEEIVDLGCGPGNSTAILRERWPSARIVGVDNSPAGEVLLPFRRLFVVAVRCD
jgi:trans-aconitate 2-methyltransferase